MAVPRNGMMEEDDNEEDNALFEEDGVNLDLESDTPPHLRELAAAAQLGDVQALRLALGFSLCSLTSLSFDFNFSAINEPVGLSIIYQLKLFCYAGT